MPDGNMPPPSGHNNPPVYRVETVAAHSAKAAEFLDAGGAWLDAAPIKDEAQAGKLADFIAGIKKVKKSVDDDRKADKKPHDDAGKAVQKAYLPILEKLDKAVARVTPMMGEWLKEVEAKQRAEAEAKRKAAEEEARRAAELEAQARARNDISGEAEAEEAAKRAAAAQKEAERAAKARVQVKSATGAGRTMSMRTTWEAEVTNLRAAFMHYGEHPEVIALFKRLAEAEARTKEFDPRKDTIPGVTLHERKKSV